MELIGKSTERARIQQLRDIHVFGVHLLFGHHILCVRQKIGKVARVTRAAVEIVVAFQIHKVGIICRKLFYKRIMPVLRHDIRIYGVEGIKHGNPFVQFRIVCGHEIYAVFQHAFGIDKRLRKTQKSRDFELHGVRNRTIIAVFA